MTRKTTILITTFLAVILVIVPISASADINSNLVAHFRLDGNTLDHSGNDNDGAVTGTEQYTRGEIRDAFDFDGSSWVILANESNFDFDVSTDAFSYGAWILSDTTGTMILEKNGAINSANGWELWVDAGTAACRINGGSVNNDVRGTTQVEDGEWHHLFCTYDGSGNRNGTKLYVDSTLDKTGTSNAYSGTGLNNNTLLIGASASANWEFGGKVDDVRVYDIELTSDQVQEIYRQSPFVHTVFAEAELVDLQNQITSVNGTVQSNVAEIDDLYDFWTDLKDSIITWLAGRP